MRYKRAYESNQAFLLQHSFIKDFKKVPYENTLQN